MIIACDQNQVTGSHGKSNYRNHKVLEKLTENELRVTPLPFGDYIEVTPEVEETIKRKSKRGQKPKKADLAPDIKVSVDYKHNLSEVAMNLCSSTQEHERFRDEVILAQKHGCKLYVLVEEEQVKEVRDVFKWVNPRMKGWYIKKKYNENRGLPTPKPPVSGQTLAKAILTMQLKYAPLEFVFCKGVDIPKKIIELLERKETV